MTDTSWMVSFNERQPYGPKWIAWIDHAGDRRFSELQSSWFWKTAGKSWALNGHLSWSWWVPSPEATLIFGLQAMFRADGW